MHDVGRVKDMLASAGKVLQVTAVFEKSMASVNRQRVSGGSF